MKLYYADHFVLPLPDGHRFPMEKYALLRARLRASGLFADDDFRVPDAASDTEILRAHDAGYLRRVAGGTLDAAEIEIRDRLAAHVDSDAAVETGNDIVEDADAAPGPALPRCGSRPGDDGGDVAADPRVDPRIARTDVLRVDGEPGADVEAGGALPIEVDVWFEARAEGRFRCPEKDRQAGA